MNAQSYSLTSCKLDPICGWVVNTTLRPLYPLERNSAPNVQEAGWAPGPVWTDAEYFFPHWTSILISESKFHYAYQKSVLRMILMTSFSFCFYWEEKQATLPRN